MSNVRPRDAELSLVQRCDPLENGASQPARLHGAPIPQVAPTISTVGMPEMQNAVEVVYQGSVVASIDPSVLPLNLRQHLELARRGDFRFRALCNGCLGVRRGIHGRPNDKAGEGTGQRAMNLQNHEQLSSRTLRSLARRSCSSRSVLGFVTKHMKGPRALLREARPNPSIEGTSNSKLRLPLAAPHVKR